MALHKGAEYCLIVVVVLFFFILKVISLYSVVYIHNIVSGE